MLAFNGGIDGGRWMVMFGSIIFAYTTILGWSYYGERAAEYLFGEKIVTPYRYLWVVFVFVGSVIELKTIITVADIMNALMAIPNLIALLLLSGTIFKLTRGSRLATKGDLDAPAIGAGDCHEEIGLGRGDDARREGRGVHTVIADGHEIGIERGRFFAGDGLAAQHPQRIGGVAAFGGGRDWRIAACLAHQRRHDHRHGADQYRLRREAGLGPECRDRCAEAVDNRQAFGRRQDRGQTAEGAGAGLTELSADFGFGQGLSQPSDHSRAVSPSKLTLRARSSMRCRR